MINKNYTNDSLVSVIGKKMRTYQQMTAKLRNTYGFSDLEIVRVVVSVKRLPSLQDKKYVKERFQVPQIIGGTVHFSTSLKC